jgi:ATP-dependent DNA ligase
LHSALEKGKQKSAGIVLIELLKPGHRMTVPVFEPPMLAKLVKVLPEGAEWEYELKLDGYRLQRSRRVPRCACIPAAETISQGGFPGFATSVSRIKAESVVLDGEGGCSGRAGQL